jgi:hypothetical protein
MSKRSEGKKPTPSVLTRFYEWLNVRLVRNTKAFIFFAIVLMNLILFIIGAVAISRLAPATLAEHGFWASIFYTITMIMDAGCIQFVVEDVGGSNAAIIIVCLVIILLGMILFTGTVIGYLTNFISGLIERFSSNDTQLRISDHTVILNWNSRASEIVNDLLYSEIPEKVVILAPQGKKEIEQEIRNRLAGTILKERGDAEEFCRQQGMGFFRRRQYLRKNCINRKRLQVVVREGPTYAIKMLRDISLKQAKAVIILGNDHQHDLCQLAHANQKDRLADGNSNVVKTLMQVADITGAQDSRDNQKIIVEVEDEWTLSLVHKIIQHKERLGKCNIVPVSVNRILGQLLSQFSVMPELNLVYDELFSYKGAAFFSAEHPETHQLTDDIHFIDGYLKEHASAIPLTSMRVRNTKPALPGESAPDFVTELFYVADRQRDFLRKSPIPDSDYSVKLNPNYWIEKRNILILGHNSKSTSIMEGFNSFRAEWNCPDGSEILSILVLDDKDNLEKVNYSRYPYVREAIAADVYDQEQVYQQINRIISASRKMGRELSVLILSDDNVVDEDQDSTALTYLIYMQDIMNELQRTDPTFDPQSVDVVVEILNPQNVDVVQDYSNSNTVISNRYISKLITQVGEKEALFYFFNDILTYDQPDAEDYVSTELYIKSVRDFFLEVPAPTTAAELIRAVYAAGPENNKTVVLGYVDAAGEMHLFSGDQTQIPVALTQRDKLIVFSNH